MARLIPGTMPWESPRRRSRKSRKRRRRDLRREYPTTDDGSTSVRAVPGGASETNRRRH